jgi:ABC-type dipeptide/oligopeptide/nickel transport system ATPase component
VSIQAQVVNLLLDLQQKLGLTLLLVAHDLRLVRHLSSRLAVMYRGRIVETGRTDAVFRAPAHAYTRALLSAVPDPRRGGSPVRLTFDHAGFDPGLELREVGPGHWAAVSGTGPECESPGQALSP